MVRDVSPKALLLALCLTGCAATPTPTIDAFAQRSANNSFEVLHRSFGSDGLVLPVVYDQQTTPASCGANALASVVNYWQGQGTVSGAALYQTSPPADPANGYSLAELMTLAQRRGLLVSAVRLTHDDITRELEAGRPVLVPVRAPAIYVEPHALPGENTPVIGVAENAFISRVGRVSEMTRLALVSHYLVIVGYDANRYVVVEPVRGYRTISFDRLERYRRPFQDAALVFSAQHPPPSTRTAQN
jgi:hypothetical protein